VFIIIGAIERILANSKGKKHASLSKNLYYFINKEKHEFMTEYDSVCFDYSCWDKKQYAFKVYMNTFYGEARNSISPFFLRELAGGKVACLNPLKKVSTYPFICF
jgi:DNA polymerase elongation subunit (family B)